MDRGFHFNILSSPLLVSCNQNMNMDIFNDVESTNYNSNFTTIPVQRDQALPSKSPLNVNNFMQIPNATYHQSGGADQGFASSKDTPIMMINKPYLVDKASMLGVPSLTNILKKWQQEGGYWFQQAKKTSSIKVYV